MLGKFFLIREKDHEADIGYTRAECYAVTHDRRLISFPFHHGGNPQAQEKALALELSTSGYSSSGSTPGYKVSSSSLPIKT
jgi:hypothetical protein